MKNMEALESVVSERRFGKVAIEKGYVTKEQVVHALEIQLKEDITHGWHRLIGMILFEQGLMSRRQINDVMHELEKEG